MTAYSNEAVELHFAFRNLHELEEAQGSNAKKAILEKSRDNNFLRDLAFAAYGGDKFNSYPSVGFKDTETHPTEDETYDPEQAVRRYGEFRTLLLQLRDRALSGNTAIKTLDSFLEGCSETEKKWYRRVLDHDLKVGANRTFGKVWDFKLLSLDGKGPKKGEIVFPGVMLCEADDKHTKKWTCSEYLEEPKLDGLRLLFVWAGGNRWSFFSRQGKTDGYNTNLIHIAEGLIEGLKATFYSSGIIDGEIMHDAWNSTMAVKRENPTPEEAADIRKNMKYHIFDHLLSEKDTRKQSERRATLEAVAKNITKGCNIHLVKQYKVKNLAAAKSLYLKFVQEGYEGAILKSPDAIYKMDNKRSKEWVKLKPVHTQDVRVVDMYEGEARSRNEGRLGGFDVADQEGNTFKVGGGFTEAQRIECWKKGVKAYKGRWMEIEFQKDGVAKCRFPVFTRWREDLD